MAPLADPSAGQRRDVYGHLTAFAAQPGADYLRGMAARHRLDRLPYYNQPDGDPDPGCRGTEFAQADLAHPFTWTRQLAFIKDEAPEGPGYLVIADDLAGNCELTPAFNFWCLAAQVVQNRRQLYFHGAFGLDLDLLVVKPDDGRIESAVGDSISSPSGTDLQETQQSARIYGQADGGGFRIVLYPRKANEPMPRVDALAHGAVLRVTLPTQTHWILLTPDPVTVTDGPVTLTGTAAVVKKWRNGRVQLTLLAPGKVTCGDCVLEATQPATQEYGTGK